MPSHPSPIPPESAGEVAWSRLALAANDVRHPMRLVTLASVDAAGRPSARLMVIRGANRDLGRIWFHTDRRSPKIAHLQRNPYVCIAAYDPTDCIHLRLSGKATLHDRDRVADEHWQQIMMSMRHAYGLPAEPAQPLPHDDPRLATLWQHQRTQSIGDDRAQFTVIEINVESIEWLQVCGSQQHRVVLSAANQWRVNHAAQPAAATAP